MAVYDPIAKHPIRPMFEYILATNSTQAPKPYHDQIRYLNIYSVYKEGELGL